MYLFKLPAVGEGLAEAEIVRVLVQAGDWIEEYAPFCEIQTDKAVVEVPSPVSGKISKLCITAGDKVPIGTVLAHIETAQVNKELADKEQVLDRAVAEKKQIDRSVKEPISLAHDNVLAMPAVRKHARALGIDLKQVTGSGKNGRILLDDLEQLKAPAPATVLPTERQKEQALTGIRRIIAEKMTHSYTTIPHVTMVDEVDVEELIKIRKIYQEKYRTAAFKMTYLPFFIKSVICALQAYPEFNASIDVDKKLVTLKDGYHIGIAAATQQGVVVPVLHNAQNFGVGELAKTIASKTAAARAGKLSLQDQTGGTFTISSLGPQGPQFFTPLINYPEVAILGIGRMIKKPVVYQEEVAIRTTCYLSLSFDHRLIDGDLATKFLVKLKKQLEEPVLLVLEE
ncbi:MAG: hypothetical protein RLZ12_143 [Bacillota bacterium]|jgi:pyruvate dehydrogenase E2 component (dihydrolipoamide acetyltransferase)